MTTAIRRQDFPQETLVLQLYPRDFIQSNNSYYNPWDTLSSRADESPLIAASGAIGALQGTLFSTYFVIPPQYIGNANFTIDFNTISVRPSKHQQAVFASSLHKSDGRSGVYPADLASGTSVSGIITSSWTNSSFDMVGSGLSGGDLLIFSFTVMFDDRNGSGNPGPGFVNIGAIRCNFPARI